MSVDISVSITEDVVDIIATPTVNIVNVTNSASINPGLYDLSQFTNTSVNPFVRTSGLSSYVPSTRTLTINGTTQDLSANRTFTISTGITIGTTAITSGTVGRVLFEGTGNVVQESANLFWDSTNDRLTIGTSTGTSKINLPDAGTTASDGIAFGNGANIFKNASNGISLFSGSGTWQFNSAILVLPTNQATFIRMASNRNLLIDNGTTTFASINGTTGNVLINTTTDAGFRLDVNGIARVSGVMRSTDVFVVGGAATTNTANARFWSTGGQAVTSGLYRGLYTDIGWIPSSGSAEWYGLDLRPTINQTGTANGITRGLYIAPILTSAFDFRAIEVTSGGAYINTTSVNASAILQADSTTKGFLPPRMTTTEKNAIATPTAGLVVYDSTLNKLCVRTASAWETITSL